MVQDMQGFTGGRVARVGGTNPAITRLIALARERGRSLVEATEKAWGRSRSLEPKLVICDGPEFESLFPDHVWWVDRVDPDPGSDDRPRWPLELLAVAARWPSTSLKVVGGAPAVGDEVVALHAPRVRECSGDLSLPLTGLFDAIIVHEYSHHADGTLIARSTRRPVDPSRAEHVAQMGAWNALTLLPQSVGDPAKHAMITLTDRQPRPYQRFRDLPTVQATLPLPDDLDDPLLVPVFATGYPKIDAKAWREDLDMVRSRYDVSAVVLVNSLEHTYDEANQRVAHGQGSEADIQIVSGTGLMNPPSGVQLAFGPFRLLDVGTDVLELAPIGGRPPRHMRYEYDEAAGALDKPLRQSACGGNLKPAGQS